MCHVWLHAHVSSESALDMLPGGVGMWPLGGGGGGGGGSGKWAAKGLGPDQRAQLGGWRSQEDSCLRAIH